MNRPRTVPRRNISKERALYFYLLEGICFMIDFDEVGGMCLIGVFLGVIAFGVALPFDEILEFSGSSVALVTLDLIHFIFLFSIN